jgi:hypothetical protein
MVPITPNTTAMIASVGKVIVVAVVSGQAGVAWSNRTVGGGGHGVA